MNNPNNQQGGLQGQGGGTKNAPGAQDGRRGEDTRQGSGKTAEEPNPKDTGNGGQKYK